MIYFGTIWLLPLVLSFIPLVILWKKHPARFKQSGTFVKDTDKLIIGCKSWFFLLVFFCVSLLIAGIWTLITASINTGANWEYLLYVYTTVFICIGLSVEYFMPFFYYHFLKRQNMKIVKDNHFYQRVYFFMYDLYAISKKHIVRLILFIIAMAMVLFTPYIHLEDI